MNLRPECLGWVMLLLAILPVGCSPEPEATVMEVVPRHLEEALVPLRPPDLIPRPKQREDFKGEGLLANTELTVYCPNDELARQLYDLLGRSTRRVEKEVAHIVLSVSPERAPPHPEGYELRIEQGRALLLGSDQTGLSHALRSLAWLRRPHGWDAVIIRDWPSFPTRGVLLHTGANSGPTHRKLLERILAPLKFNALVLECEYTQWDSHPELWSPELSIPKAQLRQTVDMARRFHIEPIPLIQTLSHMGWLFVNDQNLEYGSHSLNDSFPPQEEHLWKTVLDIYEEAIELFQPERFHIGFDEVRSLRGVFPGTDRKVEDVISEEAERLRIWLKGRGVDTLMWADMLLHRSESPAVGLAPTREAARSLRQRLSPEITLVDWQYEVDAPNFPELETLQKSGFPIMVAPWTHGPTCMAHAGALKKLGGEGLLQTTWPGRVLSDAVVEGAQYHQFASFVTAAEAAWNGGGREPLEPGRTFAWLWGGMAYPGKARPGRALVFSGHVRKPVLPSQPTVMGEVTFLSQGGLKLRQAFRFPIEAAVTELAFLWATSDKSDPGDTVAWLEVEFAGGPTERVPIRIHKEVSWLEDARPILKAPVGWSEEGSHLRCWRWSNPKPGTPVKSLLLRAEPDQPPLILYGLTLIE